MDISESNSTIPKDISLLHFNSSTSDFSDVVRRCDYVDKTLLIRAIFDNSHKKILITAPRRFGKSTNIDMVKKFVEIEVDEVGKVIEKDFSSNYKIFKDDNLLIFQDQTSFNKHFANYPVIHANFKCVSGENFDEVLDEFRSVLLQIFSKHAYLLHSNKLTSLEKERFCEYYELDKFEALTRCQIESGLQFLSGCLYKHFDKKKVFVLIDECDACINNTMFEAAIDICLVNKLLRQIFSNLLKENEFVERALLTGISYFASVGLFGVNNIAK